MTEIINKTMDRGDLLRDDAQAVTAGINDLIRALYARGVCTTSWWGTLPKKGRRKLGVVDKLKVLFQRDWVLSDRGAGVGYENRGPDYEPLPGAADDGWIPWYLYWEIFWVLCHGPRLEKTLRVLDAGGTASLFTCYLASLGCEVHSIDLNPVLVAQGDRIARAMGWNMFSYAMNMGKLEFEDGFFDHAYAVCVFEHLNFELKQAALKEIARCLKPGGILSLTFDYRNPAPKVVGVGPDPREQNQIRSQADLQRNFLATGRFELIGNPTFHDNGRSYLVHPGFHHAAYTFGSLFLRKKTVAD